VKILKTDKAIKKTVYIIVLFALFFGSCLSAGLSDEENIINGYLKSTDNSNSVFVGKNLKKWLSSPEPVIRDNALNYAIKNSKVEENQDEVVSIAVNARFPLAAERAVFALAGMKDNAKAIEKTRGLYEDISGVINGFLSAYDKLDAGEINRYIQKRGPFIVRLPDREDFRTQIFDREGAVNYFATAVEEQKTARKSALKTAGKDFPRMNGTKRKKYLEGLDNFGFALGRKIVLDDDFVISGGANRYYIYKKHAYPAFPQYNRFLGNIRYNIEVIPVGFRLSDNSVIARVRHYMLLGKIKDKWMILGI
jgi:hypothetical protein